MTYTNHKQVFPLLDLEATILEENALKISCLQRYAMRKQIFGRALPDWRDQTQKILDKQSPLKPQPHLIPGSPDTGSHHRSEEVEEEEEPTKEKEKDTDEAQESAQE